MTTSADMIALLRSHFTGTPSKPVPGFLLTEMEAPDVQRRADALWLPLATGLRGQIHGVEVKVSRADLMVELADPSKADAWMRYCDRWWLAVSDPAYLRGLDVPEHWGIMTPPAPRKRLMTIVRPAPVLHPAAQRDALATALTRLYYGRGDTLSLLDAAERRNQTLADTITHLERQVAELHETARGAGLEPHRYQRVARVLALVDSLGGWGDHTEYPRVHATEEEVARAVMDHAAFRTGTAALADRYQAARESLRRVHADLERQVGMADQTIATALEHLGGVE